MLTVADDGVGLPEQALQRAGSFGLMGLRERAHMLGGTDRHRPPAAAAARS